MCKLIRLLLYHVIIPCPPPSGPLVVASPHSLLNNPVISHVTHECAVFSKRVYLHEFCTIRAIITLVFCLFVNMHCMCTAHNMYVQNISILALCWYIDMFFYIFETCSVCSVDIRCMFSTVFRPSGGMAGVFVRKYWVLLCIQDFLIILMTTVCQASPGMVGVFVRYVL